ncbi:hypothetical protein RIF29_21254 [Crotalaria pallida]|uniref:Ankyrin repeat protein n=1 Tax=Crotalaria pallida TaxID=3830 RepID=A0AAN9I5S8_CROPI
MNVVVQRAGHPQLRNYILAIVSSLLPFLQKVMKADYLSGGTALHSAVNWHYNALSKFVNKTADGDITALHMAALNGYFDYVQLLLDLNANVSAVTFHYGTSMDLIGAGSNLLHYTACGGNLKSCQARIALVFMCDIPFGLCDHVFLFLILLARGANRVALNCNGSGYLVLALICPFTPAFFVT